MSGPLLATRRRRRVTRLGHLRACLPASLVVAGLGLLTGLVVAGPVQGAGVALGVAIAAATFAFGTLVVDAADRLALSLVLPVGLAAYATTVVVLGVLVLRYEGSGSPLIAGLPWGVLAGTLAWVLVQSWWAWTSPTPYVVLPPV